MSRRVVFIFLLLTVIFFNVLRNPWDVLAFWRYRCIDTMKESRDRAVDWGRRSDARLLIAHELKVVKSLGANCVAISTPYDDEFIPVLKLWTQEAHAQGLKVWFRGNFSGWEGWFDYPKFTDIETHHDKTYSFITKNPELFSDEDIFTPAPEPENGIIGDPRSTKENEKFLKFLTDSYDNCIAAVTQINKKVICGYFSTNGDVAEQILTKDVVSKLDSIVVIDHYVSDINRFENDIVNLNKKLGALVVLGELGAPIPDIHGPMTEQEQAHFVDQLFKKLYLHRGIISAVNYWVLSGGTTAIIDENGKWREAAYVVRNYYMPATIKGSVVNSLGESLGKTRVDVAQGLAHTMTDETGIFSVLVPGGTHRITVENAVYRTVTQVFDIPAGDTVSMKVTLQPKEASLIYHLRKLFAELFTQVAPKVSL